MRTIKQFVIVSYKYGTMLLCKDGKLRMGTWGTPSWTIKVYRNEKSCLKRLEKFSEEHHAIMVGIPQERREIRYTPEDQKIEDERILKAEKWFRETTGASINLE